MVDRNAKTQEGCAMTPLLPKSKPIRIMKPEDFPPRPAPPQPEPGPELPAQPRQKSDLLSKIAQLEDTIAWLVAPADEAPEPTPEPKPEHHFADLMLADETLDDAKARLSQRLRELRHYLIAPEIRVNEDGSLGLTGEEQSELQDLERRQTLGRWLDA